MAKRTKARGPLISHETKPLEGTPPELATLGTDATTDTGGGCLSPDPESFYIGSVAALAEVIDTNPWTLSAFLRQTGELSDCRPGQGVAGCFLISEAFALAVWAELSRSAGVSLARASRIAPRSLDAYGMLRNGVDRLPLSLDPERVGQPPLKGEHAVVLDLWRVWESFRPRFKAYAVRNSRDPNMRFACEVFEQRVRRIHEARVAATATAPAMGLSPA